MPRSKEQVSSNSTKDGQPGDDGPLPKWAEDEIKSVQFGDPEILTRSGYILAVYEDVYKIDLQIYEALSDGRTIIEGLDVPKNLKIADFLKGSIYEFKIRMFKGELSSKLVEFLKTKYSLEMNAIYRFELEDLQLMDVESDIQTSVSTAEDED
ncbi:MAG: hypothetical protein QOK84_01800 [Nitrososphaeraceae archaeon]|jgi:hypothetical protein|nr:hypothetical protein [Nitrososphaeraceae archaeon]MDW0137703.1 hypothetical protein [Nitrososphaeraceae archaeon]MDW0138734.1 hypothetical protein [Nitrososphaeraceae archaeon]MDW0141817.1 hypothetical protein [Nitrososphaeraceae archaeon]MDW0144074.1 hypothetical protein [Nitrososphaeraceae archaeon]